jgi:predicted permease
VGLHLQWLRVLAKSLQRSQLDRETSDEFTFHLESRAADLERRGLSATEARRQARLEFGGVERHKEQVREIRGWPGLEQTALDIRYGLRGLARNPVFTVTALLTLALTIGAVSTVLTLVHTYFFQQLPVDHPEGIVAISATRRHGSVLGPVSYPDYVHFREQSHTLQGLAAHYSTAPLFVTARDNAKEINGAVVSANFFPLLGIRPAVGRFFTSDEDRVPDRDRVAVLGHDLWRDWFGSSPDAVGGTVDINGVQFTVIGVAPATFRGVITSPSQIYIPANMLRVGYRFCQDSLSEKCTILDLIGRLAEGRRVQEAAAEMATLIPPQWAHAPEGDNTGVTVYRPQVVRQNDSEVWFVQLLSLVAGILLLVGCANLAGLLLARGSARVREFAIRTSLGASASRLVRQLLTESVLLALIGGGLGVLLSVWMTRVLNTIFYSVDGEGHPLYFGFAVEPVVIVGVLAISVLAGVLFGMLPAFRAARLGSAESLTRQSSASSTRSRVASWLVGIQAAIAVSLAAVAGLLASSAHLMVGGINFDSSRVALLRLRPRLLRYTPAKAQEFQRAVVRRLDALAGVESVSLIGTGWVLFGLESAVSLPSWVNPGATESALRVGYGEIGPRYFATLRTPMVAGREFDDRDSVDSQAVAIVSDALAHRLWPMGDAIGHTVIVGHFPRRVVGVAMDIPLQTRAETLRPYVYTPYWQNAAQVDARLCVRVKGDPAAMLPVLAREVHAVDSGVPIAETITLPVQMAGAFRPLRMSATFVGYAGGLTALLSVVGLYGALAFTVSRRRKEIGIRMALGAESSRVLALIVREGMTVILLGIIGGLSLATGAARFLQHLLYGSSAGDVSTYVAAALVVAGGGVLATWIPARRAASVDPVAALKEE